MSGIEIKGRIRIPFDEVGGDESDEEDDDDDMWLDYSKDGGGRIKTKKPKIRNVLIMQENGKKRSCKGRFPLTDLYWTVVAKLNKAWLRAPAAYFIEQDNGMKQIYVNLFVDDCMKNWNADEDSVKHSTKACFNLYCSEHLSEPLTFFNLESTLKDFMKSEKEKCTILRHPDNNMVGRWGPDNHGAHMEKAIFKSGLGCTVLRAVSHPKLVECLSKLLPNSFQDYLCKLHPSKVKMADSMAKDTPWEFCFRQILCNKLRMSGSEAFLSIYEKGGYMHITPEREKDALHIYEVLKMDAGGGGHMYMPFRKMSTSCQFDKLNYKIRKTERWTAALDYLEENKVIVRERFDQDVNIFLFHNWKAEVDTVNGFQQVLTEYKPEVDDLDIDLDSSDFDKIRGDRDQLKASCLISHLPIIVLSGMGGCGKTTVVTNLLKHICDRHEKKLAKGDEEELSQHLGDTDIRGEEGHAMHKKYQETKDVNSNCTQRDETVGKDEALEDRGETSRAHIIESKEGRLRRELKEDLLKILKDKKDVDCEEMKSFKKQILLVAPTGKAARLLGCKARLPSATIHSVIMSWRIWRDSKDTETEPKEWNYSQVKILVMDECSLVSVRLFAAIVSILLENAKLSKLILLGDIKQLPSIEPGDFLRDIFRAFSMPRFSVELRENHRSESTLIVENAKRISRHLLPTFDPDQRFYFIELEEGGSDNERDQTIRNLLRQNQDVQCHVQSQFVSFRNAHCKAINELCSKYYNNHSLQTQNGKEKETWLFEPGDKVCMGKNHRVTHHGKFLDEYIVELRHLLENDKSGHAGKQGGETTNRSDDMNTTRAGLSAAEVTSLFAGDEDDLDKTVSDLRQREGKVASLREERKARAAQKQKQWKEKHTGAPASQETGKKENKKISLPSNEEKLCNGEVFFIMDEKHVAHESGDKRPTKYLILSDRDPILPRVVCVTERSLRKDCKMKHSWVRTIHTYQGSESETVVYFVGPAIPQNWQHVYTAVTRGKKSVYIVGKQSQLNIAVTRNSFPRNSRLQHRLNEMLEQKTDDVERLISGKPTMTQTQSSPTPDKNQTSLSQSFESSDDSWISSMPDPYFTQALNTDTDMSRVTTTPDHKDEVKQKDMQAPCLTLKHPKVLHKDPKIKVTSLVKEEIEDDLDITGFSDSDSDSNMVHNETNQRVLPLLSNKTGPINRNTNHTNKPTHGKSLSSNNVIKDNSMQQPSTSHIPRTPTKNISHKSPKPLLSLKSSPSSQTPKKTPTRPSWTLSNYQSPTKQTRLSNTNVDTPFRDSFKSTLSLDHDEQQEAEFEDDEDPVPSTPRVNVRRKIL